MKFGNPIAFPELSKLPETGSPDWLKAAQDYTALCAQAAVSRLVLCPACGWHHFSDKFKTCLSCGGELTWVEFGEHERAGVVEALCSFNMRRLANDKPMVLG